jgi:hypothetical protein
MACLERVLDRMMREPSHHVHHSTPSITNQPGAQNQRKRVMQLIVLKCRRCLLLLPKRKCKGSRNRKVLLPQSVPSILAVPTGLLLTLQAPESASLYTHLQRCESKALRLTASTPTKRTISQLRQISPMAGPCHQRPCHQGPCKVTMQLKAA